MTSSPEGSAGTSAPSKRARRRWLVWGAVTAVVVTVLTGALFGSRLTRDNSLVGTPLVGQPVPGRAAPYLERTGQLSLGDLRGQIVVVNFWASWCVACRQEHPALTAAAAAYRDAGVRFVGVVYQDSPSGAIGFLDEMGRGGDNYDYLRDPGSRLAIDFGVFGVPETFFIDRNGKIAAKITGASSFPLLAGVLDTMLAGGKPDPSMSVGPVREAPSS